MTRQTCTERAAEEAVADLFFFPLSHRGQNRQYRTALHCSHILSALPFSHASSVAVFASRNGGPGAPGRSLTRRGGPTLRATGMLLTAAGAQQLQGGSGFFEFFLVMPLLPRTVLSAFIPFGI